MLHSFNPLGDRTPRRLSAATRELAARYLSGEIGSTLRPAPQAAGDEPYPVQLRRLAAEAETALSPDERLAGAARWLEATFHRFPGTDRPSVSHVTADFRHAVTGGLAGLEADIAAGRRANPEGAPFYDELAACIGAMRLWVERYRAELAERLEESPFFPRIAAALKQVPERPPRDFFEAVQSLWLFWTFQRLAGNWSGLGRIDELLGPFLDADLEAGRLDLGEAREILACFWIKGTEWITGRRVAGGDAQFYQNVILAGPGRDGREVCNRVTMLIFDIVEELHISDFPLGVRLSRKSPPPLLRRVAELQSRGGGIVSIYNEEVVIAALVKFGYPEKEACDFTNDGCWETLIPGETAFSYCPFDALQVWQDVFFADCNYPDFESLFAAYSAALRRRLEQVCAGCSGSFNAPDRTAPTPLLSLLMPSCIRSGRPYNRRGAKYNVVALHAGGLPDVANSFTAVRKLVYEDECCTLNELRGILLRDFGGDERLRRMVRKRRRSGRRDAGAGGLRFCRRRRGVPGAGRPAASGRDQHLRARSRICALPAGHAVRQARARLFVRQPRSVSRHRPQRARRRRQVLLPERLHADSERLPARFAVRRGRACVPVRSRDARRAAEKLYRARRILSSGRCGQPRDAGRCEGAPGTLSESRRPHFGLVGPLCDARNGLAGHGHRPFDSGGGGGIIGLFCVPALLFRPVRNILWPYDRNFVRERRK